MIPVPADNQSCWSRRSPLEKRVVYLLVPSLCLSIVLAIVLTTINNNDTEVGKGGQSEDSGGKSGTGAGDNVCRSNECKLAAAHVAQSINFNANPCDDFYQYACGSWKAKHVIPENKLIVSSFSLLKDEVNLILKNLLENRQTYSSHDVLKKPKQLYASCMNLDIIEMNGDTPLYVFLNKLGGWPMADPKWNKTTFNLTNILKELQLYDNNHLFSLSVDADLKNSKVNIIKLLCNRVQPVEDYFQLDFAGMTDKLVRPNFVLTNTGSSQIDAYHELIYDIAVQFGAETSTVNKGVKEMVDFELNLIEITGGIDYGYNLYTIPQLAGNFSGPIDWQWLLRAIFSDSGINLAEDELVLVLTPQYFTRLISLLQRTPSRTLANFLIWRITYNLASFLSKNYTDFYNKFKKGMHFGVSIPARYETCLEYTGETMPYSVSHMFVKEAFDEETKGLALDMIKRLKKAFNWLLYELDWMDGVTKEVAKEKNDYMGVKIGYPDQLLNMTYLTKLYENYTYKEDTYFDNMVTNIKQRARRNLLLLRMPVDRELWEVSPIDINAYYSLHQNQIYVPAGILQPPFFSKTFPKSMIFGSLGIIIGHEITHGFDNQGHQYNKEGNQQQWWSDEATELFSNRAQCIINQYGNYIVTEVGRKVNGIKTQGENIADNGGLRQSFWAYRNWVKEERNGQEEQLLPDLPFTNNQLFFISFAQGRGARYVICEPKAITAQANDMTLSSIFGLYDQTWCNNMKTENAWNVLDDEHSPMQFRTIGVLQNSIDFAETFNCPLEISYMNPEEKCVVW